MDKNNKEFCKQFTKVIQKDSLHVHFKYKLAELVEVYSESRKSCQTLYLCANEFNSFCEYTYRIILIQNEDAYVIKFYQFLKENIIPILKVFKKSLMHCIARLRSYHFVEKLTHKRFRNLSPKYRSILLLHSYGEYLGDKDKKQLFEREKKSTLEELLNIYTHLY